jgi:Ni/Co efflux regulator RcnB
MAINSWLVTKLWEAEIGSRKSTQAAGRGLCDCEQKELDGPSFFSGLVGTLAHSQKLLAALWLTRIPDFFNPQEFSMNRKAVVSAIMALSLIAAHSAIAQGGPDNRDNNTWMGQRGEQQGRPNNNARQPNNDGRQYNNDARQPNADARQPNRGQNQGYANNNAQRYDRGAGPDHAFHQGGRLPNQYRSNQYVVNDWRAHRLSAPPRGYHWVQTGSDYVLVAIATGVIMQLLLNN